MSTTMMHILFIVALAISQAQSAGKFPWTRPQKQNVGLPPSVEIYKLNMTNSMFDSNLTGAFTRFDFTDKNLQLKVAHTEDEKSHTPMQWAEMDPYLVYGVINGGYFDMVKNQSSSFICSNSHVYHKNSINTVAKSNIYPTVGAFGVRNNNSFAVSYIYSFDSTFQTYQFPFANKLPGPEPIRSDGKFWQIKQGIGAGAILVKNNKTITNNPQNFNAGNMVNFRHPRSGICYDSLGRLYLIAIDGRYQGSAGLTFQQFGIVMQDLGCVDALNLDGGGSTLLYANNYILNHYSDPKPRPVVSAVVIRNKNKKKQAKLQQTLVKHLTQQ